MKRRLRILTAGVLAVSVAAVFAAYGSASGLSRAHAAKSASTVTLLMGSAPDSLDPQFSYTTQGEEVGWLAYTGLLTYKHANGLAGGQLIPGLCTALPTVSNHGKTYTCTLRKGLKFSNGKPVVASDFAYTVQRAIKMPWGGSGAFITPNIVGGTAFSNGKAHSISGIKTDNKTGKITVHLTAPFGAFDNVLAFPALGVVYPPKASYKNQPTNPPPGVGPYYITNIVPNASFTAVPTPGFHIPGIPSGVVRVQVKDNQSNIAASAEAVLNNSADVFDWADTVPGALLPQIQAHASSRYHLVDLGASTYYVFMNSREKPFNSQLAREAVVTAMNQDTFNRLGSGTLKPGCFFLPKAIPGHPTAKCPYSNSSFTGNLNKARALVKASGMEGQPVTVWSETRTPRQQWMTYYTQVLNQIGFHATQKVIADSSYFSTIGNLSLHPQTGFADWNMDFPNPWDFIGILLSKGGILPANNQNFGEVQDPYVDGQVAKLQAKPLSPAGVKQWQKVDEYIAKKAYVAVFGYQTFPFFHSSRLTASVISPVYGWDWTAFRIK